MLVEETQAVLKVLLLYHLSSDSWIENVLHGIISTAALVVVVFLVDSTEGHEGVLAMTGSKLHDHCLVVLREGIGATVILDGVHEGVVQLVAANVQREGIETDDLCEVVEHQISGVKPLDEVVEDAGSNAVLVQIEACALRVEAGIDEDWVGS